MGLLPSIYWLCWENLGMSYLHGLWAAWSYTLCRSFYRRSRENSVFWRSRLCITPGQCCAQGSLDSTVVLISPNLCLSGSQAPVAQQNNMDSRRSNESYFPYLQAFLFSHHPHTISHHNIFGSVIQLKPWMRIKVNENYSKLLKLMNCARQWLNEFCLPLTLWSLTKVKSHCNQ